MFDLEKSIPTWKRNLQKQETLEGRTIADLEIHLRDIIDALKKEGISESLAAGALHGLRSLSGVGLRIPIMWRNSQLTQIEEIKDGPFDHFSLPGDFHQTTQEGRSGGWVVPRPRGNRLALYMGL